MFLLRGILLIATIAFALVHAFRIPAPRRVFFKRVLVLLSTAFVVEIVGLLTREFQWRNVALYNLFAIFEFAVMLSLLWSAFPRLKYGVLVGGIIGACGVGYSIASSGLFDLLIVEGLLAISLVNTVLFISALFQLAQNTECSLRHEPLFWFFVGSLVYFGGIIPILGSWKLMDELDHQLSNVVYWIVVVLAMFRYVLVAVACGVERTERIRPDL